MKHLTRPVILLLTLLMGLVPTLPVMAFPPLPSSFWGTIKIAGSNVPTNSVVTARINGVQYASTTVIIYQGDTVYSLDIPGDDTETPGTIEGGVDGDTIIFYVGNLQVDQTATWNSGTNINQNLTVSATFVDVLPSHWAFTWIERLYAAGITGGCGSNPLRYCPESPVTRAQMAIFLERGMRGSTFQPPAGTGLVFNDVLSTHWAFSWIEQLYADGITGGCGTNPLRYCPENPVTRAQMAIFLLRAKHGKSYEPPPATGTVFTDVLISHWAAKWIEQLAAEGVTGGCGTGIYCPENPVTRAQMAVFLVRTFNLP